MKTASIHKQLNQNAMCHLSIFASYRQRVYYFACPYRALGFARMYQGEIKESDSYYIVTI